ncbi:hypothetical protein NUW58_g7626 [Xylaria curta]|uniref:Uncharacterized protein n=1 Tax=Xylaria curta TaxID=42375 RepID=A0ACC1NGC9_9PEZI|nr:hypothetical protein NUW58_g7626 [Xylaria curta]
MSDYSDTTVNATWAAFAQLMSSFPDLMDQGITGSGAAFTGIAARSILGLPEPIPGVLASFTFRALNMTTEKMSDLLRPLQNNILSSLSDASVTSFKISDPSTNTNYTDFFLALNASPSAAGRAGLVTSRLLGRAQVSDLAVDELASYLQRTMASRIETDGTTLSIALQGGPGLRNIPRERRGAVNPVWRDTYLHIIERTNIDTATNTPGVALREAGEWFEANKETIFREWAPDTGAYMNEANPFNSEWKHDFYGTTYERLVRIKRQFDPTYTLSVSAGVDSDFWEYNMDSGKLCQTS